MPHGDRAQVRNSVVVLLDSIGGLQRLAELDKVSSIPVNINSRNLAICASACALLCDPGEPLDPKGINHMAAVTDMAIDARLQIYRAQAAFPEVNAHLAFACKSPIGPVLQLKVSAE